MSNQVIIQRHEVKNLDTGKTWQEAGIFDNYGSIGSLPMEILPTDNLALFSRIIEEQIDCSYAGIDDLLRYLYDTESGITIAGVYYGFDSIEMVLLHYMEAE